MSELGTAKERGRGGAPDFLLPAGLLLAAATALLPPVAHWLLFAVVLAYWCTPRMVASIRQDKAAIATALVLVGVTSNVFAGRSVPAFVGLLVLLGFVFGVQYTRSMAHANRAFESEASGLGLNALMKAAAQGDLSEVRALLQAGADANARNPAGATALMFAARNGHPDVAAALLDAGANASIVNDKGSTALSIAERFGHGEVSLVLTRGVS